MGLAGSKFSLRRRQGRRPAARDEDNGSSRDIAISEASTALHIEKRNGEGNSTQEPNEGRSQWARTKEVMQNELNEQIGASRQLQEGKEGATWSFQTNTESVLVDLESDDEAEIALKELATAAPVQVPELPTAAGEEEKEQAAGNAESDPNPHENEMAGAALDDGADE